jgi:hypothetical protein
MTVLLVADGHELVVWQPGEGSRHALELVVSGDVLAAGAQVGDTASLAVADVIYRDQACARPATWLGATLRDQPGCAVAVSRVGSGYLTACRVGAPRYLSFRAPGGAGWYSLACALFVHGWLAAGWPLEALNPPLLAGAAGVQRPGRWSPLRSGAPIPYDIFVRFHPLQGRSSSSSASLPRTSAASGAPASE